MSFQREQSGYFGKVRQHTRYLLQTDSTYFNIYILQRHRIARYGMYPESHSFFIPHIHVRVYTHIFMQVNPVMILVEMKSLEGNNRILRNQCESDSVPLTMSFEQRAGIYPQQYACFSFAVFVVYQQFRIAVANLSGQSSSKRELRILRSVYYTGT